MEPALHARAWTRSSGRSCGGFPFPFFQGERDVVRFVSVDRVVHDKRDRAYGWIASWHDAMGIGRDKMMMIKDDTDQRKYLLAAS